MKTLVTGLLWFMAIGCGLIGGLYFAFSAFILSALNRAGQAPGAIAMNSINTVIVQSAFMPLFLGTSLGALIVAVLGGLRWSEPGSFMMVLGGAIFFVGMTIVTMIFNVPLNNALAAADPQTVQGVAAWARYLSDWAMWNHVRTVASTLACAAFILAIAAR